MVKILLDKHRILPNHAIVQGKKIIYELCATPWNLINQENAKEPLEFQIDRYLAVLSLGLIVRGVPGIYINGLLGNSNYTGELDENRTVNREILNEESLDRKINDSNSKIHKIIFKILDLIKIRTKEKAFNPLGPPLEVINLNDSVVSAILRSLDEKDIILTMVNISDDIQEVNINLQACGFYNTTIMKDLISEKDFNIPTDTQNIDFALKPYQICWLKEAKK
jgi:hypothetical protein